MSAYGRIAMFGLAMACRRRACEELALDCKIVLGHILSRTGSKDRPCRVRKRKRCASAGS
jgi:hypothetical protein